jgi:hypothetical protein
MPSPFSIEHEWTFRPGQPSDQVPGNAPIRYAKEAEALKAIGQIGVIGSVQIARLYGFKRHHIRRMLAEDKLIQHTLCKNKNTIPVFSIGPQAAKRLNLPEPNVRLWSTERLLKSLVFFQFCCALNDKQKVFQIHAAPQPFTGRVQIRDEVRNVLVLRRDCPEKPSGRVILIAETLEQAIPYGNEDTVLLLDADLNADYRFYRWKSGSWIR